MSDLELVMWYTGWNGEVAKAAIYSWKKYNPAWSGQYIAAYLPPEPTGGIEAPNDAESKDGA